MDNNAKVKYALFGGMALVGTAVVWYLMGKTADDDI